MNWIRQNRKPGPSPPTRWVTPQAYFAQCAFPPLAHALRPTRISLWIAPDQNNGLTARTQTEFTSISSARSGRNHPKCANSGKPRSGDMSIRVGPDADLSRVGPDREKNCELTDRTNDAGVVSSDRLGTEVCIKLTVVPWGTWKHPPPGPIKSEGPFVISIIAKTTKSAR
jgi:hypothetical protein